MDYPELKDILFQFGLYKEKTPETKESNSVMNGYLDRLVKAKKLSKAEADRIREQKEELELSARAIGFKQGFHLAVRLFIEN
ncbi:MAG: hypothetical protein K2N26_00355 [Oscillospiraceae bacterium]|nr:hypothetical protein [Oscillospiraceae bacterium]